MQNEGLIEEAVIAPTPTPLATLDAVALRCRPTLSEWIERACRWPAPVGEWNFGDYHRLEVSFSPKRGRCQHLQFCFELRGLVGIEIWCAQGKSAEHGRPTSDQVSALKRLGYYFDAEMGHFRKSVPVGSREAVQTLAKEAVEVLYSALGYRGQSELDRVPGGVESQTGAGGYGDHPGRPGHDGIPGGLGAIRRSRRNHDGAIGRGAT